MLRRGDCRKLVSGLEPHFKSFDRMWNKAFPVIAGGNYVLELGKKDQTTYLLDCLPSPQPFFGYQPLLNPRHKTWDTTCSRPADHWGDQGCNHKRGPLRLHCVLGGLILQRPNKDTVKVPFLVTKGFGDSKEDWNFWIWAKHDIRIPPPERRGLLLTDYISGLKLGDIAANKGLPIEAQYVEGYAFGRPRLTDPPTAIFITPEDMEALPGETTQVQSFSAAQTKLGELRESTIDLDLEGMRDLFKKSRVRVESSIDFQGTTASVSGFWMPQKIDAIDADDGNDEIAPVPLNTLLRLTTAHGQWLVMSVGLFNIKRLIGGKTVMSILGDVVWALALNSFLVLCDCRILEDTGGSPFLPARERVCELALSDSHTVKWSVLRLDILPGEVDCGKVQILTDQGYQLTEVCREKDDGQSPLVPTNPLERAWETSSQD